jgi:hypothetical protein
LYNYLFPAGRSGTSPAVQSAEASIPNKPSELDEPPAAIVGTAAAPADETAAEPVVKTAGTPKTAAAAKTAAASPKPAPKPVPVAAPPGMPSESQVISLSRTAWQIAREHYNSQSTMYEFPDGRRFNGSQIRDWGRIPTGTRVILGETDDTEPFEGFLEIGRDGDTPQALAGKAYAAATTIYFFTNGLIRTGAELQKQPSYKALFKNPPKGTRLLVGYVYGGYVRNSRRPSSIAGIKWNYPSTYYRYPDGRILSGDDVKDRAVPAGTLVFFQE